MKRGLPLIFLLLAASALAYAPAPKGVLLRTEMELRPGARTLTATAPHGSRLFTTNTSVTFTNNAVDQTTVSHFAEGQLSHRVWKNSLGQTNRVQSFTWDARSRLLATTELDGNNNGYNWSAAYDGFGRRLQTTTILVTNGVAWTNQPKVIASTFDPSVEFLEVGLKIGGKSRWKIYGPDTDGSYGGMNGTGGFEGYVDDVGVFRAVVSDARGDVHGVYDPVETEMQWSTARTTGYGAVPEYRPVSLSDSGDLGSASAWHGRWPDRSGFYWLGARYYDPVAGRFISCDPYGHDADPSLYAFAGGDPINYFDPDGRLGKQAWNKALYGGEITLRTVHGMLMDVDTMAAMADANHSRHWEVQMAMGMQAVADYQNAGGGWSGGLNAFNRFNPVRSPFEAVSGMHLMEGPQLGVRLTGSERATQWANTISLGASLGAGAPGTMNAITADLRAFSSSAVPLAATRVPLAGPTANWGKYLEAEARIGTTPATLAEIQDAIRLNAAMADNAAAAANVPRTFGRFGTAAHNEFEVLNNQLNTQLQASGSRFSVATEQFRDAAGNIVGRRAAGSLGVDAVVRACLKSELRTRIMRGDGVECESSPNESTIRRWLRCAHSPAPVGDGA